MRVDYCDVACSLIDMLTLVYNKMYDNQYLNQVMLSYIEKIDNIIVVSHYLNKHNSIEQSNKKLMRRYQQGLKNHSYQATC
jgi:hypothetical protein